MGADNHTTVVPGNSETHTTSDAITALEDSDAFWGVVRSGSPDVDVYAMLRDDYDSKRHVPDWLTIENVYAVDGVTGVWFFVDE